jgi:hypothetical protein
LPEQETPNHGDDTGVRQQPEGGTTPGGYEYEVVDEAGAAPAPAPRSRDRGVPGGWPLAVAGVVILALAGAVAWLLVSDGGNGGDRANADVASIVNAFSSQQGATTTRYEGKVGPGFPKDVPTYPGAHLVSSVVQVSGSDASYLVVYDTGDKRDAVAKYYEDSLAKDPWQIQGGQVDRNGTVHQFSNTGDPNVTGLVLVAESNDDKVTTILESVQVVSGAKAAESTPYAPGESKPLPAGFPSTVTAYPGSTTIESAFRKQPQGNTYIASFVTKDDAAKVLDYYRGEFQKNGWTVQDGDGSTPTDPSATPTEPATAISFSDTKSQVSGGITTAKLDEDNSYTRIDVQVATGAAAAGG